MRCWNAAGLILLFVAGVMEWKHIRITRGATTHVDDEWLASPWQILARVLFCFEVGLSLFGILSGGR